MNHNDAMRKALFEARKAAEEGETPTGAIIIWQNPDNPDIPPRVIARAHNQVERLRDPTAHAEMIAITQAASALGDWRLQGTTLYVTKEPCPMCAGAIVLARIPTVVFGAADKVRGAAGSKFNLLNHPDLNHRSTVLQGVLEDECRTMLQSFFKTCRQRRRT